MDKQDRAEALVAIGTRVRQRRREIDLTQEELAEKAGLSKSFVSEVEGAQAAASGLMYMKLARVLDVSVEWLLTGDLPESPVVRPSDIQIPPFVAELAEEQGWSYAHTLDVAAALQTIVARRTRGRRWKPGREELLALAAAVRGLAPTGGGEKKKEEKKGK
jgi:transcriptional regulator with XRE-family HTH domain